MTGKKTYGVAVVGATGAVGQEIVRILAERNFPVRFLKLMASSRSKGKTVLFASEEHAVEDLEGQSFRELDIILSSAGAAVSRRFVPQAVRDGAVVIDNTSAFRMEPDVPLVIPEVNAEDIRHHRGVIANPNCSTIIMAVPLWPLYQRARIRRIAVATYQSVSGAGARAISELTQQTKAFLDGRPIAKEVFPYQIAFNLFSLNSPVRDDGYNEEELKMMNETRKIFHDPEIRVAAMCVRVPVYRAHSEAIFAQFERKIGREEARAILSQAPGVRVVDDPVKGHFPMPLEASHKDDVLVGRIREDLSQDCGIALFVSGDQLRKGAALNAVQIAEWLIAH
jgi:aspartate-semialdehyde dehydrogenase